MSMGSSMVLKWEWLLMGSQIFEELFAMIGFWFCSESGLHLSSSISAIFNRLQKSGGSQVDLRGFSAVFGLLSDNL
ncbi:unnamed protein product, partial [Nesidiocoris tenuis]